MDHQLQKAAFWKRVAAWLLDAIMVCVLAVGVAALLSMLLGYDSYSATVDEAYLKYEQAYNIDFDITQEDYAAVSEDYRQRYDDACQALSQDEAAMRAYSMMLNLALIIASAGILLAMLLWEFLIPLWLGHGQTLGKKAFGLCLVRQDGIKLTTLQLFARTLLGKCTVETLLPVYMILLVLVIGQIACLALTRNNCAIHDLLAATVVVDKASQRIFNSTDDLIAYQKKIAAERAARADY